MPDLNTIVADLIDVTATSTRIQNEQADGLREAIRGILELLREMNERQARIEHALLYHLQHGHGAYSLAAMELLKEKPNV